MIIEKILSKFGYIKREDSLEFLRHMISESIKRDGAKETVLKEGIAIQVRANYSWK